MELDEEVFRDDAFDAYAWLEEAVIDRDGRVPDLAALVPQLALLSQSLTASIHGTLHQLMLTGPQLHTQLDAMHRATVPLAQQLDSVVAGAGAATTMPAVPSARRKDEEEQDLQYLLELHEAKERLQSCSKALVEAARWEKNVRACAASIENATTSEMGEKKTMSLADRVNEMHKSLEILKDMPGADDRQRTMDRLSTQIEASLKPKLDEYLQATQLPVAQVQFCCAVFTSIGRDDHVVQAYCRCRPAQIHRLWYSFSASESGSFATWLDTTFYQEVLRMIQREMEHATDIFGAEASRVLVSLLENTLTALKDSFRDRLKKNFSVEDLLRAYQTSCAFVGQIAKVLRSTSTITEATTDVNDGFAGLWDRDAADRVLLTVVAPYQSFFTNYVQFAGEALSRKLAALVPRFSPAVESSSTTGNGKTYADEDEDDFGTGAVAENVLEAYALRVEDVSNELWTAVEDSVRMCYEFSAGAAFPDAVRVVSQAVEQLTQRLSAAMPGIRQATGMERKRLHGEPHGMLMTDWSRFHSTLALLRACGTLESDLASVEARLSIRMREQVQRLFDTSRVDDVVSHKTSPQSKRKQLQRRRSGSNVISLSALAAEPTRVATAAVMKWLKDEPEREKTLTVFVQDLVLDDQDAKLFAEAHTSLARYTRQVQTLVYDSVFAPIAHVLRTVPVNECWIKTPDASLGDLPTFSTLPQEYITMVADLLLSLLPQLEPFAESNSLQKAAAASVDAHKVCTREWATFGQLLRLSRGEIEACERIFDISTSDEGEETASEAATFVDIWTSSVASGTTAALLTAVVKIPSLSPLGAKQLEADIGYFQNVLNALSGGGIERNFLILGLQRGLQVPDAEYAAFVEVLRARDTAKAEDSDDSEQTAAHVVLRLHETLLTKRLHHHTPTASTHDSSATSQYY